MKRLIVATVLIIITAFLCIFGNTLISAECKEIKNDVKQCARLFPENPDKAKKEAQRIADEWETKQKRLAVFVNHSLLDGISTELAVLPHIEKDGKSEFAASSAKIIRFLTQIVDEERVTSQSFY